MTEFPEEAFEENNDAVASALEATASILPWLAKPQKRRFSPELNTRWVAACQHMDQVWKDRHGAVFGEIRPAIFKLYSLTLETDDIDCLRLGEALASAADCLDEGLVSARLIAALSACNECLIDEQGLEHPAFGERMQHFAARLEGCSATAKINSERSAVIDRLFVAETDERLTRMRDALDALPPDTTILLEETIELIQDAEHLALYGMVHTARQLQKTLERASQHNSLESETIRAHVLVQLKILAQQNLTVDS